MAKRKFDKCQKCGRSFTTEHHFAKYCYDCKKEALYNDRTDVIMDRADVNIHFLDFFFSVKCAKCHREIDYSSKKTQPFEAVCPGCGDRFEPVFIVRRISTK